MKISKHQEVFKDDAGTITGSTGLIYSVDRDESDTQEEVRVIVNALATLGNVHLVWKPEYPVFKGTQLEG